MFKGRNKESFANDCRKSATPARYSAELLAGRLMIIDGHLRAQTTLDGKYQY